MRKKDEPAAQEGPAAEAGDGRMRPSLILDELGSRLDRLRLLTDDEEQREILLAEFDVRGEREARMVEEFARRTPLARPDRFLESHRIAIRALEVLSRHGFRSPSVPRWLGPVGSVAEYLIELVGRYIVNSQIGTLIDNMRHLYARREAQTEPGSPERAMLRLARVEADRLAPGFKGNPIGVPTFLIGGALIPIIANIIRLIGGISLDSRGSLLTLGIVGFVITGILSWIILRGSAMAHRRIQIATRQPMAALWQTLGAAGDPPRDDALTFAAVAIVLVVIGWILLPLAVGLGFALA